MIRKLFTIMTSLALTAGGSAVLPPPAAAQWLGPHLDAQRHNNLRRHQQRMRQKRLQARKSGGTHAQRCAARYRSYDARSDTYQIRPGVRARCRL